MILLLSFLKASPGKKPGHGGGTLRRNKIPLPNIFRISSDVNAGEGAAKANEKTVSGLITF